MRAGSALGVLLALGCSPQDDTSPVETRVKASKEQTVTRGLPVTTPRYAQGIVNPLMGAFKRFDGFHLATALWPELSRFHAQIDQHDAAKGYVIGFLVNYLEGAEESSARGRLDALILFGDRQDTPKRRLRVATYSTVSQPPGPLNLVSVSSDDGLMVSAEAKLNLRRDEGKLVLDVIEGEKRYSRTFQRIDKAWALEPGGSIQK